MTSPLPNALNDLLGTAMGELTPLMTQVHTELNDTSKEFLYRDDANLLFAASVLLHLKPQQIAALILQHGINAVAGAFTDRFGRPMIENQQIADFANPSGNGSWTAFWNWTQQLWGTIASSAVLTGNINFLVGEVFDHNKGYNRAINFASAATMPPDVAAAVAPPLAGSFDTTVPAPTDAEKCGLWIYQALNKAGLLPTGQAVSWDTFDNVARANWTVIATALGNSSLDAQTVLTNAMKQALGGMSLLS